MADVCFLDGTPRVLVAVQAHAIFMWHFAGVWHPSLAVTSLQVRLRTSSEAGNNLKSVCHCCRKNKVAFLLVPWRLRLVRTSVFDYDRFQQLLSR